MEPAHRQPEFHSSVVRGRKSTADNALPAVRFPRVRDRVHPVGQRAVPRRSPPHPRTTARGIPRPDRRSAGRPPPRARRATRSAGRLGHRARDLRVENPRRCGKAERRAVRDAQSRQVGGPLAGERQRGRRQRGPVAVVRAGDHVEHQRRVRDRPGDRPGVRQRAERRSPGSAAPAIGRLVRRRAGERGRDPDRAAAVGAERQRRHARATAAAAPPLEPPAVREVSHGLRVMPVSGLSVTPFQPAPGWWSCRRAPRRARIRGRRRGVLRPRPLGSIVRDPRRVGRPSVSSTSLIDTGTPSSSPRGSSRRHRSADSAPRRAPRSAVDEAEGVDRRVGLVDAGQHRLGGLDRGQLPARKAASISLAVRSAGWSSILSIRTGPDLRRYVSQRACRPRCAAAARR